MKAENMWLVDIFLKAQIMYPKCHHSAENFWSEFCKMFLKQLLESCWQKDQPPVVLHQVFFSFPKRDKQKNM